MVCYNILVMYCWGLVVRAVLLDGDAFAGDCWCCCSGLRGVGYCAMALLTLLVVVV